MSLVLQQFSEQQSCTTLDLIDSDKAISNACFAKYGVGAGPGMCMPVSLTKQFLMERSKKTTFHTQERLSCE
eukprot:1154051-Amphidinium_carterae.1